MTILQTGRFALPLLATAQAQKEITHNEALIMIDALLHPVVEALLASPPAPDWEDDVGKCWLVDNDPTGAWAGKAGQIACWTGNGWRFLIPRSGMTVRNHLASRDFCWNGNAWVAAPVIAEISGGTVIDSEARTAINALLSYLAATGRLAS